MSCSQPSQAELAREACEMNNGAGRDEVETVAGEITNLLHGAIAVARVGGARDMGHPTNESIIGFLIEQIDAAISTQLNEIIHHQDFQRLEASWRGLFHVVHQSETDPLLKFRVLNVSKQELIGDMNRCTELEQCTLYKKVYDEELCAPGGEPFGVLIGDYEFSHQLEDVDLLKDISNVAASTLCPFISSVSHRFFGFESWRELLRPLDLKRMITTTEYARWRSFVVSQDASYVGLCLPRILMRPLYGRDVTPNGTFQFKEEIHSTEPCGYLWGNAAYAFATCLADSFTRYHWTSAIRGIKGGGLVQGLPIDRIETELYDQATRGPTEIEIVDPIDSELSNLGLMPLLNCQGTDYAVFFTAPSCRRPKPPTARRENAEDRALTDFSHILAVSRIVHYLKVMVRDKIGKFMSREDCELFLNEWISRYVTDPNDPEEMKAKYPLGYARVEVQDLPSKPGSLRAVIFLQPHFLLDKPVSSRVVAELPQ